MEIACCGQPRDINFSLVGEPHHEGPRARSLWSLLPFGLRLQYRISFTELCTSCTFDFLCAQCEISLLVKKFFKIVLSAFCAFWCLFHSFYPVENFILFNFKSNHRVVCGLMKSHWRYIWGNFAIRNFEKFNAKVGLLSKYWKVYKTMAGREECDYKVRNYESRISQHLFGSRECVRAIKSALAIDKFDI